MPVFYKVRKNNNDSIEKSFGKYYGHIVYVGTKTVDDLADEIQAKCTVHKADVKAVVAILIEQIKEALVESYRVELDGLGVFKYGMSSKPADAEDEFTTDNIRKLRVLFQPSQSFDAASRTYTRALTTGVKFKEWTGPDDTKKKKKDGTTTDSGSQSTADSGSTTGGSDSGTSTGGSDSGSGSGSGDSGAANL